jgi:sugar phosphate isomerase/epimerase
MKNRIGSSVGLLLGQGMGILEVLKLLAEKGFGAEIFTSNPPEFEPYTDEDISAIRKAIEELPFATAHTGIVPWQPDSLKQEVALCSRLGVSILVVHGSTLGVEDSPDPPDYSTISELASRAKELNVTLALENGYTGGLKMLVSTMERIGDEPSKSGLGICIDTWRACQANDRAQNSVYDYLREVGEQLIHMHVDDMSSHRRALPGHGEIDWARIGEILSRIRYSGNFIFELACGADPLRDICEVRDYLVDSLSCLLAPQDWRAQHAHLRCVRASG